MKNFFKKKKPEANKLGVDTAARAKATRLLEGYDPITSPASRAGSNNKKAKKGKDKERMLAAILAKQKKNNETFMANIKRSFLSALEKYEVSAVHEEAKIDSPAKRYGSGHKYGELFRQQAVSQKLAFYRTERMKIEQKTKRKIEAKKREKLLKWFSKKKFQVIPTTTWESIETLKPYPTKDKLNLRDSTPPKRPTKKSAKKERNSVQAMTQDPFLLRKF